MAPDDDHYDAKVKVLGEYIDHHVVEEHSEMFPKCRRAGMDLVGLRAELESRKMSLVPEGRRRVGSRGSDGQGQVERHPGLAVFQILSEDARAAMTTPIHVPGAHRFEATVDGHAGRLDYSVQEATS